MTYFLPVALLPNLEAAIACGLTTSGEGVIVQSNLGLQAHGIHLHGDNGSKAAFLARTRLKLYEEDVVVTGDQKAFVPMVVAADPDTMALLVSVETDPDHILAKPRHQRVVEDIEMILTEAATFSGLPVHLHLMKRTGSVFQPYLRDQSVVHVVLGASPPGFKYTYFADHLFGIQIHPEGTEVEYTGSAVGYEGTVTDDDDHVVGQIIGSTIYLYLPCDVPAYLGTAGPRLFHLAFARVWNTFITREAVPEAPVPEATAEKFVEMRQKQLEALSTQVREELHGIDEKIESALRRYHELVAERHLIATSWKASGDICLYGQPQDWARDWERMISLPFVARVTLPIQSVIQVRTKRIIMEYEGVQYDLGHFFIRMAALTRVTVWSEEPTHPDRIPHPHMGADGTVCFGNVGIEIMKRHGEGRQIDALALTGEWLQNGYDHAVAANKITEWPIYTGEAL